MPNFLPDNKNYFRNSKKLNCFDAIRQMQLTE